MSSGQLEGPELQALLEQDPAQVEAVIEEVHPQDVADIVEDLQQDQAGRLMEHLPTEFAAQVFERLDQDTQAQLTETLGLEKTAELALEMDPDDRADFFRVLPSQVGEGILHRLGEEDPEAERDVRQLRPWPATSAGGLMTTDYISVSPQLSRREAIEEVRKSADHAETIDTLFVTGPNDSLLGILPFKSILLAQPTARVSDVMSSHYKSVPPDLDQEDVARKLAKYDLTTLPVVSE